MQRATRWFLGLPDVIPSQDDVLLTTTAVALEPLARKQLLHAVDVRGRWTGGALFGTRHANTLTVTMAHTLAPPGVSTHPLTPSLPYLIGITQGVSTVFSAGIDWVGQWLTAPDGRLPDRQTDLAWVSLGGRQGLIDDQHPLIVIGLREGILLGRAYLWMEGHPMEIPCLVDHVPHHSGQS